MIGTWLPILPPEPDQDDDDMNDDYSLDDEQDDNNEQVAEPEHEDKYIDDSVSFLPQFGSDTLTKTPILPSIWDYKGRRCKQNTVVTKEKGLRKERFYVFWIWYQI